MDRHLNDSFTKTILSAIFQTKPFHFHFFVSLSETTAPHVYAPSLQAAEVLHYNKYIQRHHSPADTR